MRTFPNAFFHRSFAKAQEPAAAASASPGTVTAQSASLELTLDLGGNVVLQNASIKSWEHFGVLFFSPTLRFVLSNGFGVYGGISLRGSEGASVFGTGGVLYRYRLPSAVPNTSMEISAGFEIGEARRGTDGISLGCVGAMLLRYCASRFLKASVRHGWMCKYPLSTIV